MKKRVGCCVAVVCLAASGVHAEDAERIVTGDAERIITTAGSRGLQIQAQRAEKELLLAPDDPDRVERALHAVKERHVVERITGGIAGLRVRLGGLTTGSGFAGGPEYYRRSETGSVLFHTAARGSARQFYVLDLGLHLPRLAGDRMFLDLYAARRHYPHIDYYGPGPDSARAGRTSYRFEDLSMDVQTGVKLGAPLRLGVIGRYMLPDVGPGNDSRFAPTESVFGPDQAPGIQRQSDYLSAGGFLQFDTRDNPGGPRSGGNFVAQYMLWSDRKFGISSFNRLDVEAQRYIPFFNARRVIAFRGRTSLTDPRPGQFVPFWLQPRLGGSEDLRGFRPFRFHDNNAAVATVEYRWEVFSGLDMALFADAGQVFRRARDIGRGSIKTSYGFGFRFNVRNDVFLRIDNGFSREGFQLWFKFDNVF